MGAVAALTVLPNEDPNEVEESATEQYTVTAVDAAGAAIPLPAGSIAWTVSNVAAGTITSGGLLTAGTTNATYQIRATHTRSGVYAEVDTEIVNP
jgi:fibronectin type 3 domain-containing protein